eukprot:353769_1
MADNNTNKRKRRKRTVNIMLDDDDDMVPCSVPPAKQRKLVMNNDDGSSKPHHGKSVFDWTFPACSTLIQRFKSAAKDAVLRSDIFHYQGFAFLIECTPNGFSSHKLPPGNVTLWLALLSMPDSVSELTVTFTFVCNDVGYSATTRSQKLGKKHYSTGVLDNAELNQFSGTNSFTINCYITIEEIAKKPKQDSIENQGNKRNDPKPIVSSIKQNNLLDFGANDAANESMFKNQSENNERINLANNETHKQQNIRSMTVDRKRKINSSNTLEMDICDANEQSKPNYNELMSLYLKEQEKNRILQEALTEAQSKFNRLH